MTTIWYLLIGLLLIVMALAGTFVKRLPLNTATLYLFIGYLLGPSGADLIKLDPIKESALLEVITEAVVLISLFSAGLKLRLSPRDKRWGIPIRLATTSMVLTVGLMTLVGLFVLGFSLGEAVLLAAILAPTDPVLASDVQVETPGDTDRLRLGLTGEAGLNDGTAFPFVMLGLGLLGLHRIGELGWRWLAVDVLWSVTVGIGIGWLLGALVGNVVLYLRRVHKEAVGLDEFIALGLMALAYGTALLMQSYGFLAVFFAGLAVRRIEYQSSHGRKLENFLLLRNTTQEEAIVTHPEKAPAYMAGAVLAFNEQLERISEVGVVLLIGGMLSMGYISFQAVLVVPLLFLIVRPVSVYLGLANSSVSVMHRNLIGWFGIRGVGSLYYLMYAIQHGVPNEFIDTMVSLVVTVIAVSIVMHGISATPLMQLYRHLQARRKT